MTFNAYADYNTNQMKRTYQIAVLLGLLVALVAPLGVDFSGGRPVLRNETALAAPPALCPGGPAVPVATTKSYDCPSGGKVVNGVYVPAQGANQGALSPDQCVKISLPVVPITGSNNGCGPNEISNDPATGGAIVNYLRGVLQLMGLAVGMVIILLLIIGGVQYITSAGNSAAVASAKNRIVNAITGLILFVLMYAILNFAVPGGIL